MGEVVPIDAPRRGPKPRPLTACPERFTPEDTRQLLLWAKRKNFTLEQVYYARGKMQDWWESRRQKRANWVAVLRNGMRSGGRRGEGWLLEGFEQEIHRTGKRQHKITHAMIEHLVAKQQSLWDEREEDL